MDSSDPPSRSIIITGASSGIGEALAYDYAAPGVTLWLSGRNLGRLDAVAAVCRDRGATTHPECIDVADMAAMTAWIGRTAAAGAINLVIANAGISGGTSGIGHEDAQQTRDIFAVNLAGVLNTVLPALDAMQRQGFGQIALVSSVAGFRGLPHAPAYSASKAAVLAYGDGLRGELRGSGIDVTVICPGFVVSRITDANSYHMPLIMTADRAAGIIRRGLERKRARITFPWPMRIGTWFAQALPTWIMDPILTRMPRRK